MLNQAENFPFFAVVVVAHIALRGTKNGSSEVMPVTPTCSIHTTQCVAVFLCTGRPALRRSRHHAGAVRGVVHYGLQRAASNDVLRRVAVPGGLVCAVVGVVGHSRRRPGRGRRRRRCVRTIKMPCLCMYVFVVVVELHRHVHTKLMEKCRVAVRSSHNSLRHGGHG